MKERVFLSLSLYRTPTQNQKWFPLLKNSCRFTFTKQSSTPSGNSLGQRTEMISSVPLNIPADRVLTGELPARLIANGESVGQMIPLFPKAQMRVSSGNFFTL